MRTPISDRTQWPDHAQKYLAEAEAFRNEVIEDGSLGGGVCVYISKAENIKAYLSCKRDDNGQVGPLFYEAEPFYPPELSEEEELVINPKTRGDAILATMQAARAYRDGTAAVDYSQFDEAHAVIERLQADGYLTELEVTE
ncbi:hypothetical protein ACIGKR_12175 [Rhodococcus qingshengii]|uniref:hypothetical protein n=1 Tax=Rhodococcus qingshengii TaxID=334542 RepID=UPI0037CACE35